uniref:HTH TFE/IIEalpha-type domain-containing protein n=1 Tax=Paramoeba aestuarina TaxID=180227 RepID=A0A7S4KGS3_9EUKA|mmetsp:Transcript_18513/g.29002  ORF Transcript_18513/g.29002 Transcript_18513/m.29002 type:complete len:352 (+) Transcript_18513:501-1556(+)|eukprot:CAMPEP_0201512256 /NCGR_PEP_ID=MMETSP0161_2-20130828/4550_1 /ASSEMBLY_ACC=CAM_ASM_000251 /TAXON_ID=180227 /ORGANISM="Neoparamoeba aestuarina, Strain SoJaBio B1-5/56/2" /LENGTH=351 /DNA_ID=CAMNT_0047908041 /DNA_START=533 /DNA_END=1588 /DNA_ORIENTATION=+
MANVPKKLEEANKGPTDKQYRQLERVVRLTVRAFFDPAEIVVIDELVRQRQTKVKDEALAKLLHLKVRDVQRALNKLHPQMIVAFEKRNEKNEVVTSQEENNSGEPGQRRQRSKNIVHTLWYIDYPKFLDMLRYKLSVMQNSRSQRQSKTNPYECKKCEKEYDVLVAALGHRFLCEKCGQPLTEKVVNSNHGNLDTLSLLTAQLQKCDDIPPPEHPRFITDVVEHDESGSSKHAPILRYDPKAPKSGDIKVVLDYEWRHPALFPIVPDEDDSESSSKGPPPWMNMPINAEQANSGRLIIPVPRKEKEQLQRDNFGLDVIGKFYGNSKTYNEYIEYQKSLNPKYLKHHPGSS